jgi:hypothetical protein
LSYGKAKFKIGLEASHGNFMLAAMNVGMQKLEPESF